MATTVEVIQTDQGVFFEHEGQQYPVMCQWFAKCTRHAATTRVHPTMGDVPICFDCNNKIERLR
jgi:hypothetical protein